MSTACAYSAAVTSPLDDRSADRFDEVAAAQHARLFALALSVLRDRHEAEDAVQETLVRAWSSWDQLRDPAARPAWLTTICVRHCLRRRDRIGRAVPAEIPDDARTSDAAVPWAAQPSPPPADPDLDRAFRTLPLRQRAAVYLHHQEGHSVAACGELMGCSEGTVRTHLNRALATLRKELGDG